MYFVFFRGRTGSDAADAQQVTIATPTLTDCARQTPPGASFAPSCAWREIPSTHLLGLISFLFAKGLRPWRSPLEKRKNSDRFPLIDKGFNKFPAVGQTRPMSRGCDAFRPRPRRSVGYHRMKNALRPIGAWRSFKGDTQGGTPWAAFGLHPL